MKTILYQGRPAESDKWLALPDGLAATYKSMGYGLRELVLREDAEAAIREEHDLRMLESRYLGKAERLLESLGYRSAGNGEWTAAKQLAFNVGLEEAAQVLEAKQPELAKMIRARKIDVNPRKASAA